VLELYVDTFRTDKNKWWHIGADNIKLCPVIELYMGTFRIDENKWWHTGADNIKLCTARITYGHF